MQTISFQELIDKDNLQHLQDEFCKVLGVYAYCLDGEGEKLTGMSGPGRELAGARELLDAEVVHAVLSRVEGGSLEEQAVEETENARIAAVAIRVSEDSFLYYVVMDISDRESHRFYEILDLLRDVYQSVFASQMSCFSAEAESRSSRYAQLEMGRTVHALETTTRIVQLLDSDAQIEQIMKEWAAILAEYLEVDTAQIFRLNSEDDTMDVLCEWCDAGQVSFFDKTSHIPSYDFLQIEKPLVVSSDSRDLACYEAVRQIGMQAVMLFPILCQGNNGNMVLSLNYRKQKHRWSVEEIRFTADAVRILQSILTRRIQKNSLASSYEVLKAILDNVGCAVYVTDPKSGNIIFANNMLRKTFAAEWKNGTLQALVEQEARPNAGGGSYEIFYGERESWYDLIYRKIPWVDGSEVMLYSLYDITDRKIYQKKIEQQAYTDFLTGLYNRMCCEKDLARQVDEARRNGTKGAIIYLDLDDFKHINDGLGHQYGDVLLKSISHSLRDIQGIQNNCYRMGGDEFVIVIPPESYNRFEEIVDNIKKVFSRPWYLKDADYYCTTSMGIVTFPDSGDSVADLIKKADIAMYEAKKGGKNRTATYSEGQTSASGRRLDMEKNMRDATVDGYKEFEVYYQPIIDIRNREKKCVGAEALIRWNSTKLGFISPGEFIPLAEYLGLINPIGNHVLEEACKDCRRWNENGYPDFRVNVNLSVVQLLQTDVVEIVEETLQKTGLNPRNLTLEVTESLAINDMSRMKIILNKIKALGVSLALDDFGTGYSALNHIREIPIDVIKVDQSFVKELAEDAYSQSFIKLVAELAHTIGMDICVEGIETASQFKVLQGMKVRYIQGFYFDRPMPKRQFEEKYVAKKGRTM